MTPKLTELVEISHAPANFLYFVNQCNTTKDTLEKEIASDIVESNIEIKATPKYVFVQDKLIAEYNFTAIDVNESVDENMK